MSWALLRPSEVPPGGFPYEQTSGIQHFFPDFPDPVEQARRISAFRAGNGLQRPSPEDCYQDLIDFTAQRLGYMKRFFYNTDQAVAGAAVPVALKPRSCGGCGARFKSK